MYSKRSAFTLVELSIVLVILGLLVGGVLAGQTLIRASELRTLVRDRDIYMTGLNAFKEKYFYLPGDMPNAVKFWGAETGATTDGVDSSCASSVNTTPETLTCNGDGSGFITDQRIPADVTNRDQNYEAYRAWQQLANAGLVQGQYAGTNMRWGGVRGDMQVVPGMNTPKSAIGAGAAWNFRSNRLAATAGGIGSGPNMPVTNFMTIGAESGPWGEGLGAVLTTEEAWGFDTKIDDGKPGRGRIKTYASANPNCMADTSDLDNTDYKLDFTGIACTMIVLY